MITRHYLQLRQTDAHEFAGSKARDRQEIGIHNSLHIILMNYENLSYRSYEQRRWRNYKAVNVPCLIKNYQSSCFADNYDCVVDCLVDIFN